ncbi:hypothetical protein NDU88_002831 [Pleurodeles waltl]|uniref:Uncharacterized protein n=1 Tax=Pleurodeles waltl TaxID=8319 RepID=A0AAV7M547_PLEWA|nr:hypothetical protein NDU88_002831 [Pleurodeles waltl]
MISAPCCLSFGSRCSSSCHRLKGRREEKGDRTTAGLWSIKVKMLQAGYLNLGRLLQHVNAMMHFRSIPYKLPMSDALKLLSLSVLDLIHPYKRSCLRRAFFLLCKPGPPKIHGTRLCTPNQEVLAFIIDCPMRQLGEEQSNELEADIMVEDISSAMDHMQTGNGFPIEF